MNENEYKYFISPSLWLYGILPNEEYIKDLNLELKRISLNLSKYKQFLFDTTIEDPINNWINKRIDLYNRNEDLYAQKKKGNEKKEHQLYVHNEEYSTDINEESWRVEILSFYTMKILASLNNSIKGWIINNEVQLFLKRFYAYISSRSNLTAYNIIIKILSWLYENNEIIFEINNIKIDWKVGLSMFEKREHYLLQGGYIIVPFDSLKLKTQQNYDSIEFKIIDYIISHRLSELLYSNFDLIEVPLNHNLSMYSSIQSEILQNEVFSEDVSNSIVNLETEILPASPLCIIDLDNQIMSGAGTNYGEAIQLSFYMKQFLDLNDLREYFWSRDKRNSMYSSPSEMYLAKPKVAALLKQQYGYTVNNEVMRSYQPYKCSNCQSSLHCFFTNNSNDVVCNLMEMYGELLLNENTESLASQILNKIKDAVDHEFFSMACGYEMYLRLLQYCLNILPEKELEKLKDKNITEYIQNLKALIKQKTSIQVFYSVKHYYTRIFNLFKKINEFYNLDNRD